MITVKDLRDFIKDIPDDTEVRIESEFHRSDETYYHHACEDMVMDNKRYLILSPDNIFVGDQDSGGQKNAIIKWMA